MAAAQSIEALATLLRPPDEGEDSSDNELEGGPASTKMGPGSIGPPKRTEEKTREKKSTNPNDIWIPDEVGSQCETSDDPRPAPEHDMVFQQSVFTEDLFLGMGNKNPSTASCENLVIKIKLPETNYSDVHLDVTDTFLDCRTPKHKLGLHLPHRVDSKNGRAKWDSEQEQLTVTLKLNREYDFLNQ
ncbi:dynein axonemal assembly factor 6-like [Oscarella lobularis]|uniref:dynein axonemal assembly factor 6-like n=1 Tax=Oscarella lobularis TaxID=121494 RepID=UPI0033139268